MQHDLDVALEAIRGSYAILCGHEHLSPRILTAVDIRDNVGTTSLSPAIH